MRAHPGPCPPTSTARRALITGVVGVGLAAALSACGDAEPQRDAQRRSVPSAWPARTCAALELDADRPRTGRCTQDGRRTLVVERGATVRSGDLTVRLVRAAPRRSTDGSGDFGVVIEVVNDAEAPRPFEADARLSGGEATIPFLPSSTFTTIGDGARTAIGPGALSPEVPARFDLRYAAEQLAPAAPARVTQRFPGARAGQPEEVVFLLRPAKTTVDGGDDAGTPLTTTPSRLPGTALDLPGARAVMPRGWSVDRAITRRLARTRLGPARPVYATAWVRAGRSSPREVITVTASAAPGAGAALEDDPSAFLRSFLERQQGASGDPGPTLRPATDLGGQTAALLIGAEEDGKGSYTSTRALISARGDVVYGVSTIGSVIDDDLRGVLARIRRSWSWRESPPDPGATS